jgi:hypothetical protein
MLSLSSSLQVQPKCLSHPRPQPPCLSYGVKGALPAGRELLEADTQRCYNVYMEHGKRFSIRFPLDLLETLKQFAREDTRSINGEIVWILGEYAKQRKGGKRHAQSIQVSPVSEHNR